MKRLAILLVALVLPAVVATGEDKKDHPANDDLKSLQGTWVTLKLVINGQTLVDLKEPPKKGQGTTITYNEHKWVINLGQNEFATGTSKLDPTKKPKQIDLSNESGPDKGKTLLAIYELNGDEYKVCIAAPGKDRPTEFSSKKDSGQRLIISKRRTK